ncbi:MAG: hypothetical protein V4511_01635 [Bacteroidota bacterium]
MQKPNKAVQYLLTRQQKPAMTNAITTLLILLGLNSMAQSEEKINKLFDKIWSTKTYEIGGQNFPATDVGIDNGTIFYADHGVKSLDNGIATLSKWKYNATQNSLTLYSENVEETTEMKISVLTETEFVWETTNPEGLTMIIHMLSSAENNPR